MARGSEKGSDKSEKAPRDISQANASGGLGTSIKREAGGIVLLALAIFLGLSLVSLELGSGTLMGPFGGFVAVCCYALFGLAAQVGAVLLGVAAIRLLRGQTNHVHRLMAGAFTVAVLFCAVLLHLATGSHRLRGYSTGGLIGEYGAELMVAFLGTAGTLLFACTGILLSTILATSLTASGLGRALLGVLTSAWSGVARVALLAFPPRTALPLGAEPPAIAPLSSLADTRRLPAARGAERTQLVTSDAIVGEASAVEGLAGDALARGRARREIAATQQNDIAPQQQTNATQQTGNATQRGNVAAPQMDVAMRYPGSRPAEPAAPSAEVAFEPTDPVIVLEKKKRPKTTTDHFGVPVVAAASGAPAIAASDAPAVDPLASDGDRTEATLAPRDAEAISAPTIIAPVRPRPADPVVMVEPRRVPQPKAPLDYIRLGQGEYRLPDLSFLDFDDPGHGDLDRTAMLELASRLEKTLADYGVKGRVSEIHPGPVVTMYEFVPQAGTKLSKITSLSNDLAMALEALKVRIVAPIPGKAAVGIEVPNRVRETVYLKEIIGSEAFARGKSKLTMALGKDIAGAPTCVDLAKMPHLLVAGTTGSGKSVSVNAMICSLLFNATPEEVKLIMIDPKMLELSIYEGIPHLLLPVVTDPKKANLALRWAVEEMERRYDIISKSGVRDVGSYNKKVEKDLASAAERADGAAPAIAEPAGMLLEPRRIKVWVKDEEGGRELEVEPSEEAVRAVGGVVTEEILEEISEANAAAHKDAMLQLELSAMEQKKEPPRKLPYIVIIIDEFADLMMVASKEVEMSVARIAQKARAAGIHLLLATQRPSVDVITGLIKANFPSRIAFQVVSKIDARTILDQQGAESLLGMGDMLFTDRGLALKRVHGPLVTDVEIHRIVEFLKSQGKPVYDLDILKPRDEEGGEEQAEEDSDEMYDQAVAVISEMRQASTSMLQRRLRLGYNRAARMIERMEREGIVGPADGARPREVLVHSHAA